MQTVLPRKTQLILFFLGMVIAAAPAAAQEENYAPGDTVFQEIRLTEEGVAAVDTAGYDWYYDFALGTFVVGSLEDGQTEGITDVDSPSGETIPHEERCTEEKKIKLFAGPVQVGYDEYVEGDIIVYGRVTIKGWVKGNVTSMDSRVLITRTGRVDGDVTAPEIIVKDGAMVLGTLNEGGPWKPGVSPDGLIVVASLTLLFLFAGFLVVTLMPRQIGNFHACIQSNRVKTFLIGLFFILAMPLVMILLTITIVGVVLLPVVPFVYLLAMIMGVISFGDSIGQFISQKLMGTGKSLLFRTTVGVLVFMAIWFATAILLGSAFAGAKGLGIALLVVSIVISAYPVCVGTGSALLTRFGFRAYAAWAQRKPSGAGPAPTPAPPPIPKTPPEPTPSRFRDDDDETSASPPRKIE